MAGAFVAEPLLKIVQEPWGSFLNDDVGNEEIESLRKHERTGRSIGQWHSLKI